MSRIAETFNMQQQLGAVVIQKVQKVRVTQILVNKALGED